MGGVVTDVTIEQSAMAAAAAPAVARLLSKNLRYLFRRLIGASGLRVRKLRRRQSFRQLFVGLCLCHIGRHRFVGFVAGLSRKEGEGDQSDRKKKGTAFSLRAPDFLLWHFQTAAARRSYSLCFDILGFKPATD